MKSSFTSLSLALAALVPAGAAVLVQDNFNDNSIDLSKWSFSTASFPNAPAGSIAETNMRMEFDGRPRLNTVSTIDPDAYTGGISITGQIEFVTNDDIFKILTRSDGIGTANYGEIGNGIQFVLSANGGAGAPGISGRGSLGVGSFTGGTGIDAVAGDVFDFEIIDNGTSGLSFTVTRVGGDAATSTSTAVLTSDPTTYSPLVTFHNREGNRSSYLDDVVISSIPEPSAAGLLGIVLVGGLLARRRRA